MKKLLIILMAFVMTLSLAACGGETNVEAPPAEQQGAVVDEQAQADGDYAKLQGFLDRIGENYADQQALGTLLEEVKSGQKEESVLLDAYKQLAEDSNGMLEDVKNTVWATNYYDDKVAVLTACVEALALYMQTVYEASVENDKTKLEVVAGLIEDYDAKTNAFLDVMGVE